MRWSRSAAGLIGLDIGSIAITAVQLEACRGGTRVCAIAREPLPTLRDGTAPRGEAIIAAIRRVLDEHPFTTRRVAAALPASAVQLRAARLPRDRRNARALVRQAIRRLVPIDPDDAVCDAHVDDGASGAADDAIEVLVAAAPRSAVDDRVRLIADAGAEPAVIDLDVFALHNACEANYDRTPGLTVLLDLGAGRVRVIGVVGTRPIVVPSHEFDGQGLEQAVERCRAAAGDRPLDRILLSGDGAREQGLADALLQRFGVDVERLDPFRRLPCDAAEPGMPFEELAPVFTVATGLALRRGGDR